MNRRGFLGACLAAAAAPAIVKADSLMRIAPPRAWHRGEWLIVPSDTGLTWDEALRSSQGWRQWGIDAGSGDITAIALRTGEIGAIDCSIRFVETPLMSLADDLAKARPGDWQRTFMQEPQGLEPPKRWRLA